jgi:hypothetical protein
MFHYWVIKEPFKCSLCRVGSADSSVLVGAPLSSAMPLPQGRHQWLSRGPRGQDLYHCGQAAYLQTGEAQGMSSL